MIKEDSFSDHRPIAIILKCQVKKTTRKGTKQTKRLDLTKFENGWIRRLGKCKERRGSKLESDEERTNGVNRRDM